MPIKTLLKKICSAFVSVGRKKFSCPICGYRGPFNDYVYRSCVIRHNNCPKCLSSSRHRLQHLALRKISEHYDFSDKVLLHFAPEACMQPFLKQRVRAYHTSDISAKGVDCHADICHLPFESEICDIVFASHVMEHIHDDRVALKEIWRILKPGGMAILPVPVLGPYTVEYPERNMEEYEHVRAPGLDYFKRYEEIFSEVRVFSSRDFPKKYQTFVYEDRENWPETMPLRLKIKGKRHADFVPICLKDQEK